MLNPVLTSASPRLRSTLADTEQGIHRAALALVQVNGGLSGLSKQFTDQGLRHLVDAWSEGRARRLTPHQLYSVIGNELLADLAEIADLSLAQTLAGLSDYLPGHMVISAGAAVNGAGNG